MNLTVHSDIVKTAEIEIAEDEPEINLLLIAIPLLEPPTVTHVATATVTVSTIELSMLIPPLSGKT